MIMRSIGSHNISDMYFSMALILHSIHPEPSGQLKKKCMLTLSINRWYFGKSLLCLSPFHIWLLPFQPYGCSQKSTRYTSHPTENIIYYYYYTNIILIHVLF